MFEIDWQLIFTILSGLPLVQVGRGFIGEEVSLGSALLSNDGMLRSLEESGRGEAGVLTAICDTRSS